MSDAQRSELGRRFAQGDLPAGVELLQVLARAGELRPDALHLGAHLGDAAAGLLAGREPPLSFESWVLGLEHFGPEVWARVGLAALRSLLPLWSDAEQGLGGDARLELEISRLEDFMRAPSAETAGPVGCSLSEPSDLAFLGGQAVDVWRELGLLVRSPRFTHLSNALDRASFGAGEDLVRAAVRAELCAWLFPDPAWAEGLELPPSSGLG